MKYKHTGLILSFFLVEWLGKNVRHHDLLTAKNFKIWLKCSKTVPKNEIWIKKSITQNLLFGVIYLLMSDFKSQNTQKLATKITHLTIQFRSKTSFYKPHLTQHKKYTPAT